MLSALLDKLPAIIGKVIDSIKLMVAAYFIHRATEIEGQKNALEIEQKITQKQLEISAQPDRSSDALRDSMRRDEL